MAPVLSQFSDLASENDHFWAKIFRGLSSEGNELQKMVRGIFSSKSFINPSFGLTKIFVSRLVKHGGGVLKERIYLYLIVILVEMKSIFSEIVDIWRFNIRIYET